MSKLHIYHIFYSHFYYLFWSLKLFQFFSRNQTEILKLILSQQLFHLFAINFLFLWPLYHFNRVNELMVIKSEFWLMALEEFQSKKMRQNSFVYGRKNKHSIAASLEGGCRSGKIQGHSCLNSKVAYLTCKGYMRLLLHKIETKK